MTYTGVLQWVIGIGAPLLVAVVWALFVARKASHHVDDPARLVLELAIFGAGVAALAAAGRDRLALIFGVLVAVHLVLTFSLDHR